MLLFFLLNYIAILLYLLYCIAAYCRKYIFCLLSLMSLQVRYSMLVSNKECIDLRGDLVQYAFMHSAFDLNFGPSLCVKS
jgi:hypothetical protein